MSGRLLIARAVWGVPHKQSYSSQHAGRRLDDRRGPGRGAGRPRGPRSAVSLTTQVRTLRGVIPWSIDTALGGAVCNKASNNVCTDLWYPYLLADLGVAWHGHPHRHVEGRRRRRSCSVIPRRGRGVPVVGQTRQGCRRPSARKLSFILIGNPSASTAVRTLPTPAPRDDAEHFSTPSRRGPRVRQRRRLPDDPWNLLAAANSVAGYLFVHTAYSVDLVRRKAGLEGGNTTYVLIRTKDLLLLAPVLWPLRFLGSTSSPMPSTRR